MVLMVLTVCAADLNLHLQTNLSGRIPSEIVLLSDLSKFVLKERMMMSSYLVSIP